MSVYVGAMPGASQDEEYNEIVKLLEPMTCAAAERISHMRAASSISEADLKLVRMHLATKLVLDEQITTLLGTRIIEEERCWSVSQKHLCNFACACALC